MSRDAIAAVLARDDLACGERLFEAVLGYSAATGVARLLLAAMAALADENGAVRDLTTERICAAAGIAAKSYQRAKTELLASGALVLVNGVGGRGNANVWTVPDPRVRAGGSVPRPRGGPFCRPALGLWWASRVWGRHPAPLTRVARRSA